MSTIKATTLSTQSNATVSIDTVVNGTAKAWVNFNGTGTVAIRASFNVASITDNGVGDYTANFTTAMPNGDYCLVANGVLNQFNNFDSMVIGPNRNTGPGALTTTSANIRCTSSTSTTGSSAQDGPVVSLSIFR